MSADSVKKKKSGKPSAVTASRIVPRVVRSPNVPALKDYREYRPYLRRDFYHSCAYCTMTEAEAQAVRFTIDHYEPQEREDLINVYSNLMYACDECNSRKGDRVPSDEARKNGIHFFRPDEEIFDDHFALRDVRLHPQSRAGDFTIKALDLNRLALRRLREIRERLNACASYVGEGIAALSKFSIDHLPQQLRAQAQRSIKDAINMDDQLSMRIEEVLRAAAKSPLLEEDPNTAEETARRLKSLKNLEALYPGTWRARNRKKERRK